ncbi:MAG TPA: Rrf2 family transcriptional regulator [Actinomycetota bacterium]|jgi:Rrf2 family protein|nr:Rrf2 family transcriptional regulator [Actinomycetota bacterium]
MRFSQRTEYALRALVELGGRQQAGPVPSREIARLQKIPERFCEQVLADLRRAGLIESQRGATGGVKLARDPATLTVSEVVEVVEGPVVTQACLDPFDDDARSQAHSSIQELWLDVQITIRDRLASVTLADLVARQQELDQSSYLVFQI